MGEEKIADFINSLSDREIVFTRNASKAINLVTYTWGVTNLTEGDETMHKKSHYLDVCGDFVESCSGCIEHFERSEYWKWTCWTN